MLILKLTIHCHEVFEVQSQTETIRMILFDGTCSGPYLEGRILPGGVDTQHQNPDGTGTLSARYMIRGTTPDGTTAMLYIDNRAKLG